MSSKSFAEWIRGERIARGLSQEELEDKAKLSRKYVSKMENGSPKKPGPKVRAGLHEALGTSDADLEKVGVLERVQPPGYEPIYIYPGESSSGYSGRASPIPAALERQAIREIEARYSTQDHRRDLHALIDRMTDRQVTAILLLLEVFEDSPSIEEN